MTSPPALPARCRRIQMSALAVGLAALLACLVGCGISGSEQFFRSYLVAYLVCWGMALGSLAMLLLHHLVGGGWGFVSRRLFEAGARTLPFVLLLFVPLLLGVFYRFHDLYPWTRVEEVAADAALRHKALYLNAPFFAARAAVYFAVWLALARLLDARAATLDASGEVSALRRIQNVCGPGLILCVLTVTFAAIDWAMSLEPHWFSSLYGVIFVIGQVVGTLSLVIVTLAILSPAEPLRRALRPSHLNDLGNLLLAFVMLWAYVAFSQYLIIWSADLPEEIPWYRRRTAGGWQWIALGLVVLHFATPFLVLLSRRAKRNLRLLAGLAGFLLCLRVADVYWLVAPAFQPQGFSLDWMDVLLPIGLGGLWFAVFLGKVGTRSLLPLRDPRFAELIEASGRKT